MKDPCPLLIAPLTLADLNSVMLLESMSFQTPWSRAIYQHELTRNRFSHYLKVSPALGKAVLRPLTSQTDTRSRPSEQTIPLVAQGGMMLCGDEMHIVTIAVLPAWRGRSIGEWLLLALLSLGRSKGAAEAILEVRADNHIAQCLYQKLNFVEIGYRRRYYADKEDALVMSLENLNTGPVWGPLETRFKRLSALQSLASHRRTRHSGRRDERQPLTCPGA